LYDNEIKAFIIAINKNSCRKPDLVRDSTWRMRNELVVNDNVLKSNNGKLFVPFRLRLKALNLAHGIHHGVHQTIERLRNKFVWPNLKQSVIDFVRSCRVCALVKPKFVSAKLSPFITKAYAIIVRKQVCSRPL